jgi:ABC-type dipeptide/oligopeptide/nickel transport system permease component
VTTLRLGSLPRAVYASLVGALLTVAGNFVADIALTIADPRIGLA